MGGGVSEGKEDGEEGAGRHTIVVAGPGVEVEGRRGKVACCCRQSPGLDMVVFFLTVKRHREAVVEGEEGVRVKAADGREDRASAV